MGWDAVTNNRKVLVFLFRFCSFSFLHINSVFLFNEYCRSPNCGRHVWNFEVFLLVTEISEPFSSLISASFIVCVFFNIWVLLIFCSTGCNYGGLNGGSMHGGAFIGVRAPFTPSQWMELEHQALIYKYITANVPVPSNLLIPIRKALESAGFSTFSGGFLRPGTGNFPLFVSMDLVKRRILIFFFFELFKSFLVMGWRLFLFVCSGMGIFQYGVFE